LTPFRKIAAVVLFFLCFAIEAQNETLEQLLKRSTDTYKRENFDSSIAIADELITKAKKEGKNNFVIKAMINQGLAYTNFNRYKEAIDVYYTALGLCTETDTKEKASIYSNLGNIHFTQGNYAIAKENYKKEIAIRRALSDEVKLASNILNLSAMHRRLKEFDSSLMALKEASFIVAKNKDAALYGHYHHSLGAHFSSVHKSDSTKTNLLDSAAAHFNTALDFWLKKNDAEEALRPLFNLGYVYQIKK
jgi:tetratricopeptide (TPR) repeat protein